MSLDPFRRTLLETCITNKVVFRWSPGVHLIHLRDARLILTDLPRDCVILGVSSFIVKDMQVQEQFDFDLDFGSGIPPDVAQEALGAWPNVLDRWVEIVGQTTNDPSPSLD
jgi:hypothetical protein